MTRGELMTYDEEESGQQTTALSHATATSVGRVQQEVQAAVIMAKRYPRDEVAAVQAILKSCKRRGLAEESSYEYKRGTEVITGPSIRLAEELARRWGNIQYDVQEVERRNGESTCVAYAWDIETNLRVSKTFTVRHIRETKKGMTRLTSDRDIYEHIANMGSRRVRACILAIVPIDVQEDAIAACDETLKSGHSEPIEQRIRKMLTRFAEDFQVTQEMIEAKLGHSASSISENELVRLRKMFTTLRDNVTTREELFDMAPQPKGGKVQKSDIQVPGDKKQSPPERDHGYPEDVPEQPQETPSANFKTWLTETLERIAAATTTRELVEIEDEIKVQLGFGHKSAPQALEELQRAKVKIKA